MSACQVAPISAIMTLADGALLLAIACIAMAALLNKKGGEKLKPTIAA